jgi:hypothetical protein
VAHAYNPSYSGSRDLKDHSSKLAWENSSSNPISKKTHHKKKKKKKSGLMEWLKVKALSSKLQYGRIYQASSVCKECHLSNLI